MGPRRSLKGSRSSMNLRLSLGRRSVECLRNRDETRLDFSDVPSIERTLNLAEDSNIVSSFSGNPDWYKNIGIDNSSEMVHVNLHSHNLNTSGEPFLLEQSNLDHALSPAEIAKHLQSSVIVDPHVLRDIKKKKQEDNPPLSDAEENTSIEFVQPSNQQRRLLRLRSKNQYGTTHEAFDDAFNGSDSETSTIRRNSTMHTDLQTSISVRSGTEVTGNAETSQEGLELSIVQKGVHRRKPRKGNNTNREAFERVFDDSDSSRTRPSCFSNKNSVVGDNEGVQATVINYADTETQVSLKTGKDEVSWEDLPLSKVRKGLLRKKMRIETKQCEEAYDEVFDAANSSFSTHGNSSHRNTSVNNEEMQTSDKASVDPKTQMSLKDGEAEVSLEGEQSSKVGKGLRRKKMKETKQSQEVFDKVCDDSDSLLSRSANNSNRNSVVNEGMKTSVHNFSDTETQVSIRAGTTEVLSNVSDSLRKKSAREQTKSSSKSFNETRDDSDPFCNNGAVAGTEESQTGLKNSLATEENVSVNGKSTLEGFEISMVGNALRKRRLRKRTKLYHDAFCNALNNSSPCSVKHNTSSRTISATNDKVEEQSNVLISFQDESGGTTAGLESGVSVNLSGHGASSKCAKTRSTNGANVSLKKRRLLTSLADKSEEQVSSVPTLSLQPCLSGSKRSQTIVTDQEQRINKTLCHDEQVNHVELGRHDSLSNPHQLAESSDSNEECSDSDSSARTWIIDTSRSKSEVQQEVVGDSGSDHSEEDVENILPITHLLQSSRGSSQLNELPPEQVSFTKKACSTNHVSADENSIHDSAQATSSKNQISEVRSNTPVVFSMTSPGSHGSANNLSSHFGALKNGSTNVPRRPAYMPEAKSQDSRGITETERENLRAKMRMWLTKHKQISHESTASRRVSTKEPELFKKPINPVPKKTKKVDPYFGDYRPPRKVKPRPYVTNNLYKFLERKLSPCYGLESRLKAEEFVTFMCHQIDIVIRRKTKYHGEVKKLRNEMVELGLIMRQIDFHLFIEKYLPMEFRVKAIPCTGCDLGPPAVNLYKVLKK